MTKYTCMYYGGNVGILAAQRTHSLYHKETMMHAFKSFQEVKYGYMYMYMYVANPRPIMRSICLEYVHAENACGSR